MVVYEAVREYEGRKKESTLAETVDVAKAKARNWVNLSEPAEWVDESPEWDYKDEPKKLVLQNTASDVNVYIKRRGVSSED